MSTVEVLRGCSSMVEHQLPKLTVRVRFPSPAPHRSYGDRQRDTETIYGVVLESGSSVRDNRGGPVRDATQRTPTRHAPLEGAVCWMWHLKHTRGQRGRTLTKPTSDHDVLAASTDCRFCHSDEALVDGDDQVFVLPSLGSFVEGWLLVVPQRHVIALVELTDGERRRFLHFLRTYEAIVEATYGPHVTFEHGPAAPGRLAGCGVDHAHMHIVPTRVDLRQGAKQFGPNLKFDLAADLWDAAEPHGRGLDYLYLRDQQGRSWISADVAVPSQLFRRVLAQAMNVSEWDWKANGRMATVRRTLATLDRTG